MKAAERLEAELERTTLHGLACEYDQALEWVDDDLRRRLRRPLFALRDFRGRWGQWSPARREIALGRDLVRRYPWGAVREVLRHEMAHQLADVIDGGTGTPHGEAFRRACRMLRADPAAAAGYRPLDGADRNPPASDQDRVRLKVRKLFALADSPNPHEAASAMRKARQLMERCTGGGEAREAADRCVTVMVGTPRLRHFRDDYLLAQLLIDLYGVEGVWVPAYVLARGKMGRALELSATPTRVQIAAYAHDFVHGFIDRHWECYGKRTAAGRRARRDFAAGILEGFRAKVFPKRPDRAAERADCQDALVACREPQLATYLRHRYPCLRRFRRSSRRQDDRAYAAGLRRGEEMVIHQGIGAQGDRPQRPPPQLPAAGDG